MQLERPSYYLFIIAGCILLFTIVSMLSLRLSCQMAEAAAGGDRQLAELADTGIDKQQENNQAEEPRKQDFPEAEA